MTILREKNGRFSAKTVMNGANNATMPCDGLSYNVTWHGVLFLILCLDFLFHDESPISLTDDEFY